MKVLLVIAIFFVNYVTSLEKYAVKSYPKKVKPFGAGKILINPPKYLFKPNLSGVNNTQRLITTPVEGANARYTVFQVISNSKTIRGVPDSPYFSLDQTLDQKPRVKKVLPDYVWSSLGRIKRSVTEIVPDVSKGTPEIENVTVTTQSTTALPTITKSTEKPRVKSENPDGKQDKVNRAHDDLAPEKNNTSQKEKETTLKKELAKKETTAVSKVTNKREIKLKNATKLQPGSKQSKAPRKRKDSQARARTGKQKTRNGTKSKTKLQKRKSKQFRNGTAVMRAKTGNNTKSKSKTKQKKSLKGHSLRRPKSPKKSKKSAKRNRKGNSTNIKALKETRRLTAARQALIEDYPYTVSIQKDGVHWCSGALLNPRLVITTANCLWKSDRISRMEVRCGSSYSDKGGQLAGIQEVLKHPNWGLRHTPDNDIALVLLDKTIKFSHSVHGVDLPNRVMMPAFDDAWITSFGSERRDGLFEEQETTMQVYHGYVMSNESCNNVTMRFGVVVTENFICFSQSGKNSPCTRDTGAPAVSDGILWGLASWSIRKLCGTERFPSVFSYTASHTNMDFITEATRQMMSDKRLFQFLDRTFQPKLKIRTTRRTTLGI